MEKEIEKEREQKALEIAAKKEAAKKKKKNLGAKIAASFIAAITFINFFPKPKEKKDYLENFKNNGIQTHFEDNYETYSEVNFRSSPEIQDSNIIRLLSSGTKVTISEPSKDENNGWLYASTKIDGNVVSGYISERYVKTSEKILENVDFQKYINATTNLKCNVIATANENADLLCILKPYSNIIVLDYNNVIGENYTEIFYEEDGKVRSGYININNISVNGAIQEEEKNLSGLYKELDTKVRNGDTNNDDKLYGIDLSNLSPGKLNDYLDAKSYTDAFGFQPTYNEDLDKKINYVMLKIGASGYGKSEDITIIDFDIDALASRIKILEEKKVPYGFYYYSTSINKEEAVKEANTILSRIQTLKNMLETNNLECNVLPCAIDVEINSSEDRQINVSSDELTDAKVELSDILNSYGINNMLYTAPKDAFKMDIDRYLENVYDSTDLWLVNTWENASDIGNKTHQKFAKKHERNLVMEQKDLDVEYNDEAKGVDVNLCSEEWLLECVKKKNEGENTLSKDYSGEVSEHDINRNKLR